MLSHRPVPRGSARPGVVANNNSKKVAFSNDENAFARAAKGNEHTAINKTPANKSTRRAFGDISNRKKDGVALGEKSSTFRYQSPSVAKLKSAVTNKTAVRKTPFRSSSTTSVKRQVQFNIPDESTPLENLGIEKTRFSCTPDESRELDDSWFLEEPEKPYGMLYSEQILSWDTDDGSVISLEGVGNLKEDLKQLAEWGHQLYIENIKEDIKKKIQAHDDDINAFNKKDEEVPPPPNSQIISFFDDLDPHLSINDSFNESFRRVDISFG